MNDNIVAIVTGGASGIGKTVVKRFIKKNYKVAVVDLKTDDDPELKDVRYYIADVSNQQRCKEVAKRISEEMGRVDILVNCAGIGTRGSSIEYSDEMLSNVLDVNLKGTVYMCQAVIPYMKSGNGGAIVNIGSMLAHFGTTKGLGYGASKGGVIMATKCFAVEMAKYNIRVNAVSPGYIETPLTKNFYTDGPFLRHLLARTPQNRLGRPEEVAAAIDFLTSSEASFITGVDLPIDGGLLAGDPAMSSNS